MPIDTDTVRRIAHLSRIAVEEEELAALAGELNGILGWIEQLNEVDIEGVEPMTTATPRTLRRRADEATEGDRRDDVLRNAPETRDGFFVVPKVVE
ncbi:MAG TPA: Asp-tRNA(Asn)/Glu-tRNA(Gln) amidotransferase subunit GatC [Thermohalobaculum sp.]|nr:Asp-tRNA(Asn)/Glu-tRNA(Gln) amidotransferase subunit GatC [Thermohalobaculum sp.]